MAGQAAKLTPAKPSIDMAPSPAISLLKKAPASLQGRKIVVLITDGVDQG